VAGTQLLRPLTAARAHTFALVRSVHSHSVAGGWWAHASAGPAAGVGAGRPKPSRECVTMTLNRTDPVKAVSVLSDDPGAFLLLATYLAAS
jgi:hypothetical protein